MKKWKQVKILIFCVYLFHLKYNATPCLSAQIENACFLLVEVRKYEYPEQEKEVMAFIRKNAEDVFKTVGISQLSRELLNEVTRQHLAGGIIAASPIFYILYSTPIPFFLNTLFPLVAKRCIFLIFLDLTKSLWLWLKTLNILEIQQHDLFFYSLQVKFISLPFIMGNKFLSNVCLSGKAITRCRLNILR